MYIEILKYGMSAKNTNTKMNGKTKYIETNILKTVVNEHYKEMLKASRSNVSQVTRTWLCLNSLRVGSENKYKGN